MFKLTVLISIVSVVYGRPNGSNSFANGIHWRSNIVNGFELNDYHSYSEIVHFVESFRTNDSRVTVQRLGLSTEKRPIQIVKIAARNQRSNKSILIDAGVHAREWIGITSVLHLLANLAQSSDWPDDVNVYLIPIANPDGYEYSRVSNRNWRTTRSGPRKCGVDMNRNFPFHWRETGTSSTPCTEIFGGYAPLSEPEAAALANFMRRNKQKLRAYISVHSYQNSILVPFGYQTNTHPKDYDMLLKVGKQMANRLNMVYGNNYTVMNSADLYPAAGGSDDFAKSLGIKYSYTFELTTGFYRDKYVGFSSPREMIEPTANELRAAIGELLRILSSDP
ncbi:Peptidase-M14 domain-containing protein [Aphelenchoides besseyi]|nr:Peptidase-M14 domain-containing protein [Aphelenchoides besseyi]